MTEDEKKTAAEQMQARFVAKVRKDSPQLQQDEVEFIASMLRDGYIRRVQEHIDLYGMTRNGLSLWRALRSIVDEGEVIPQELLKKFLQWGESLEKAKTIGDIARALELVGDKDTYKGKKVLQAAQRRRHIAQQVHIVRSAYSNLGLDEAFRIVARNSHGRLSYALVKKAHYDYFATPKRGRKPRSGKDLDVTLRGWLKS